MCLQNFGDGVVRVAGLHMDQITETTNTALSEDAPDVSSVVLSWALELHRHFLGKDSDRFSCTIGEVFRKVKCAELMNTTRTTHLSTRRLNKDDHLLIAAWILQGLNLKDSLLSISPLPLPLSHEVAQACWVICEDLGDPEFP